MDDLTQLIEQARRGEAEAFTALVTRFRRMVLTCAAARVCDWHLAEDIAQEAFVEAYTRLGQLREPRAFAAWLRRIVIKHCDRHTRRKGPRLVSADAAGDAARGSRPDQVLGRDEHRAAVFEALDELPPRDRELVWQHYISGYPQVELARLVGLPAGTVKTRLHRARRRLKEGALQTMADSIDQLGPDEPFAQKVAQAVSVYSAKGPSEDCETSEWKDRRMRQTRALLRAGDEGYRVAEAMSHSPLTKARLEACNQFWLRREERGKAHLLRLMQDVSHKVRARAVTCYAKLLYELTDHDRLHCLPNPPTYRASAAPEGIERIIPMLEDENDRVRWYTVLGLGPSLGHGNEQVEAALRKALGDRKHKVMHAAAKGLGVVCPGCGG